MKIKNAGYIKLHRKFLKSNVACLRDGSALLFIKFLLVADENGQIKTSIRELKKIFRIGSHNTLQIGLEQLKEVSAIDYKTSPSLLIQINNWATYQARYAVSKTDTQSVSKTDTGVCQKLTQGVSKTDTPKNGALKVPVQLDIKEYKNLFKNSKTEKNSFSKTLNILNPVTDLEKLIKYYLQLTNHPGFGKPNANDVLNVAVQQDIPNFEIVLANCKNVTQAAKCVRQFIQDAKGTYNLFYLPKQINAVRQKVEEQDRRDMIELKRREEEYAEYKRIEDGKEEWSRETGKPLFDHPDMPR